jgi:hypothetical protein
MLLTGVGVTLAMACGVIVGLFAWLAVDSGLWPLMVAKVVQEIVGYGLLVPAQQVLFTVVSSRRRSWIRWCSEGATWSHRTYATRCNGFR